MPRRFLVERDGRACVCVVCVCALDAICQFYLLRRESRQAKKCQWRIRIYPTAQARLWNDQPMYRQIKIAAGDRLIVGELWNVTVERGPLLRPQIVPGSMVFLIMDRLHVGHNLIAMPARSEANDQLGVLA